MKREILKSKVYHDGTSMIVLRAGDKHDVPARFVQTWIDEGVLEGKTSKQLAKEKAGAVVQDGTVPTEPTEFAVKSLPGGRYKITGPGLDKPEIVKGKTEADVRLLELKEARKASEQDGGDDADAAPID